MAEPVPGVAVRCRRGQQYLAADLRWKRAHRAGCRTAPRAAYVLIFTSVFTAWNTGLVTWARQRRGSANRFGEPGPMLPYAGLDRPAESAD